MKRAITIAVALIAVAVVALVQSGAARAHGDGHAVAMFTPVATALTR